GSQAAPFSSKDVQPEIWIAQELRRIGDEFNASYCPRRVTFIFLLSISLHMASKREKLNHLWKLVLR
uniref:Bcl-x interacting BH3 domain-containing protein n=1 Tax=Athene cunicularia TaxID=194338 RepID=A0A663MLZ1_ATHCN